MYTISKLKNGEIIHVLSDTNPVITLKVHKEVSKEELILFLEQILEREKTKVVSNEPKRFDIEIRDGVTFIHDRER